jgi:hypothetical protein
MDDRSFDNLFLEGRDRLEHEHADRRRLHVLDGGGNKRRNSAKQTSDFRPRPTARLHGFYESA